MSGWDRSGRVRLLEVCAAGTKGARAVGATGPSPDSCPAAGPAVRQSLDRSRPRVPPAGAGYSIQPLRGLRAMHAAARGAVDYFCPLVFPFSSMV